MTLLDSATNFDKLRRRRVSFEWIRESVLPFATCHDCNITMNLPHDEDIDLICERCGGGMTWLTRPNPSPQEQVNMPSQDLDDNEHTLHMTDSNHGRHSQGRPARQGRVSAPKDVGTRPLIDPPLPTRGSDSNSMGESNTDPVLSKPVPPVPKLSSPTHIEPKRGPRQQMVAAPMSRNDKEPNGLTSIQLAFLIITAAIIGAVTAWFIPG